MTEAKRRGIAVMGAAEAMALRPCHFGRKPKRGGSLARERNMVARASFVGAERAVREVIFCDVRFSEIMETMITVVVKI